MRKLNKKILKEAANQLKQKNRLQKLAGVEQTGCTEEYLSEGDQKRAGIGKVPNLMGDGLLTEGKVIVYFCHDDGSVVIQDDGTIKSKACLQSVDICPPCKRGCVCHKSISNSSSVPSTGGGRGNTGEEAPGETINEAEEGYFRYDGCTKMIAQSGWFGENLHYKDCEIGNCNACLASEEDCSCQYTWVSTGSTVTGSDDDVEDAEDMQIQDPYTDPSTPEDSEEVI